MHLRSFVRLPKIVYKRSTARRAVIALRVRPGVVFAGRRRNLIGGEPIKRNMK